MDVCLWKCGNVWLFKKVGCFKHTLSFALEHSPRSPNIYTFPSTVNMNSPTVKGGASSFPHRIEKEPYGKFVARVRERGKVGSPMRRHRRSIQGYSRSSRWEHMLSVRIGDEEKKKKAVGSREWEGLVSGFAGENGDALESSFVPADMFHTSHMHCLLLSERSSFTHAGN